MEKIKELEIALKEKARELYSIGFKEKRNLNIKEFEIGFQNVIEAIYCDKKHPCWWQVCKLDIFMHLLENKSPSLTIKAILKNIIK